MVPTAPSVQVRIPWRVYGIVIRQMCAMLAVAAPRPILEPEMSRLSDQVETLMVEIQEGSLGGSESRRWDAIEPGLAAVLDSAIVAVPSVARRLVSALQRLGWLLRSGAAVPDVEDTAVDELETVLECLLAYAEALPIGADRSPAELLGWVAETLGVPRAEVALRTGVSLRTLQRWLRGEARPGPAETAVIRRLARVVNEVRWALSPEAVTTWLDRPTPYLEGRAPSELIRSSEPDADAQLDRLTATLRYG